MKSGEASSLQNPNETTLCKKESKDMRQYHPDNNTNNKAYSLAGKVFRVFRALEEIVLNAVLLGGAANKLVLGLCERDLI